MGASEILQEKTKYRNYAYRAYQKASTKSQSYDSNPPQCFKIYLEVQLHSLDV